MDGSSKVIAGVVAGVLIGGLIGWMIPKTPIAKDKAMQQAMSVSSPEVDLHLSMRKLWEDHIVWTRLAIMAIAANSPDKDATVGRLLQNPTDMANAIKIYYGNDAASQFEALMKDHLAIAAELVQFAAAQDRTRTEDAEARWFKNADDLATALSSLNPNWPREAMKSMLEEHLTMTKSEAVNIITKNYQASIADYDKIHNQALMMADGLAGGIVKQFPDKFR